MPLLVAQLRKEWRAREEAGGFRDGLSLEAAGVVLGAGTVLAKTGEAEDRDDTRLKALLSVAYGRPVTREALGHVKAAVAGGRATGRGHRCIWRFLGKEV